MSTEPDNFQARLLPPGGAALARRDGTAVRAMRRMVQESADALGNFRAEDMLKGAGIRLELLVIGHVKGFREQPFGEPVSPDDAGGTLAPC